MFPNLFGPKLSVTSISETVYSTSGFWNCLAWKGQANGFLFTPGGDVTPVHDKSSFNNSREVVKVQLGHSEFIMWMGWASCCTAVVNKCEETVPGWKVSLTIQQLVQNRSWKPGERKNICTYVSRIKVDVFQKGMWIRGDMRTQFGGMWGRTWTQWGCYPLNLLTACRTVPTSGKQLWCHQCIMFCRNFSHSFPSSWMTTFFPGTACTAMKRSLRGQAKT